MVCLAGCSLPRLLLLLLLSRRLEISACLARHCCLHSRVEHARGRLSEPLVLGALLFRPGTSGLSVHTRKLYAVDIGVVGTLYVTVLRAAGL